MSAPVKSFQYQFGCWASKKEANEAADQLRGHLVASIENFPVPHKAVQVEGSRNEYRIRLPRLSEYVWPETGDDGWEAEMGRISRLWQQLKYTGE